MRKKINSEAGFTLAEILMVTVIMVMLGLMLMTGMGMATNGYQDVKAQSEAELLLSTAMDAIADDLRFAREVQLTGSVDAEGYQEITSYTSVSFGKGKKMELDSGANEGRIVYGNKQVLSVGAYGLNGEYRVEKLEIKGKSDASGEITFKIHLEVQAVSTAVKVSGDLNVRCLNKK